jgi:predicted outer membrane repeat protein
MGRTSNYGGAISLLISSVLQNIQGCNFINNLAFVSGGALYLNGNSNYMNADSNIYQGNRAISGAAL